MKCYSKSCVFMYICKQPTCAPTSCVASLVNHHGELFHVAIDGIRLTFVLHLLRHCKPLIGYVQLLYTSHCVCCASLLAGICGAGEFQANCLSISTSPFRKEMCASSVILQPTYVGSGSNAGDCTGSAAYLIVKLQSSPLKKMIRGVRRESRQH